MAKNVSVQAIGGSSKVIEVNTVGDAKQELGLTGNYTASVNGVPAKDDQVLAEYSFVTFAPAVKGGRI